MPINENSLRVIIFAFIANVGIAIAKFVGAYFSKSTALLAEAIHSVVDCANQVLLLVGRKRAQKPPTELHPLGYGREAYFWSFIVAILLFSMGGLFAVYEGIHKIRNQGTVDSPKIALIILGISIVLEAFSFKACLDEVGRLNKFGSLWEWFHRTTSSELLVVFTEDLAALIGLATASIFLLLSLITGEHIWDAIGSIMVGAELVIVAILLSSEIKSLIIGEAPMTNYRPFIEGRIKVLIPGGRVLRLLTLQLSTNEVMLSCKIHPGQVTEVKVLIDKINELEAEIKIKFPEVRWQFLEPDFVE